MSPSCVTAHMSPSCVTAWRMSSRVIAIALRKRRVRAPFDGKSSGVVPDVGA